MSAADGNKAPERHKVFKLKEGGKAYQAAMALHTAVEAAITANPFGKTENITPTESRDYWQVLSRNVFAKLQTENPHLLKEAGLFAPAIQVTTSDDGYPRAYENFPVIYIDQHETQEYDFLPPETRTDLYLYAPVDYKGHYFKPADSELLGKVARAKAEAQLFAGGWLTPVSILDLQPRGVTVPGDFNPARDNCFDNSLPGEYERVVFVAEGRSLDLINNFRHRQSQYKASCSAFLDEIKRLLHQELEPQIKAMLPPGEDYYVNASITDFDSGKPDFKISIRREGNTNIMAGGQPVAVPPNPYFSFRKESEEYVIRPANTPEGRALRGLYKAIPATPLLKSYPELRSPYQITNSGFFASSISRESDNTPRIREFSGKTFLVYKKDKGTAQSFIPPGAVPVSTALFRWLDEDETDRNTGIVPPPMPDALQIEKIRVFSRNDPGNGKPNLGNGPV